MKRFVLVVLACVIWFGAFFRAAYDLWAACAVFMSVTLLVSLYLAGKFRDHISLKLPFISSSALFLSAVWLSTLHAWDTNTARLEAWGWSFAVILFYLLLNALDTEADWKRFFYWSGAVMAPIAAICLWQQCTGYPDTLTIGGICLWEKWTGHPDAWGRWEIPATLINSLVLAGFTLNWTYFYWGEARRHERAGTLFFLICLFVLALARSSWSLISLASGFAFYYRRSIISWIQRHQRAAWPLATLLFAVFAAVIVKKVRVNVGPYHGSSRYYYWYAAMRMWLQHPWTGVGLGGYATAYPYFRSPQFQSTLFAHSFPIQWLSETGILGTVGFLAIAASVRRHFNRSASSQAALVAVLCFSLMSINLEYLLNKILILIILASALRTDDMPRYRIKPLWVGTFGVSLWLLSPFWIKMFVSSQSYATGLAYEMGGDFPKAQKAYLASISIDNANADAYAALARIHERAYLDTHSLAELSQYSHYIQQAIHWKKDVRYTLSIVDASQESGKQLTIRTR